MIWAIIEALVELAVAARVLLRPHRDPAARIAWLVVVLSIPVVGIVAYLLLGETSIGRARAERLVEAQKRLPKPADTDAADDASDAQAPNHAGLFRVGRSISGYPALSGNRARLLADSDAAIDALVADIDSARDHVHLLFYIWLPDGNGLKVADALKRASARGVTCRAMVDDIGSRTLIRSPHWAAMRKAGVKLGVALRVGNPLLRALKGRIDLRNHRKIAVIDNRVTYCGSQNCADPAFLPKAKFAPWVDVVIRFEGPVVAQNQHLFASDWMANCDEDITAQVIAVPPAQEPGFVAQVVASGPTVRNSAMAEMFQTLAFAARRELVISTPYYVPTGAIQAALCAAANRGVDTTLILPARNDDFAVGATSRSYYHDLLSAGVRLYEYLPGLLHSKTLTLDGEVSLIGSANLDRRSFDLNYENNILFHDPGLTADLRARQAAYIADSRAVSLAEVQGWSRGKRLWNNALAIVGPVL